MTLERPPRLKQDGELGAVLRAADQAELAQLSPERIAKNAAGVQARIAAGTATTLWKLVLPFALVFALAIPIAWILAPHESPERAVNGSAVLAAADGGVPVTIPVDAEPEVAFGSQIDAMSAVAAEPAPAQPRAKVRIITAVADAGVDATAAPPNELAEQIRIYEAAREAAKRGELGRAIELVDELLRRFPLTQLRADAELTRAEYLARANRLDDAAMALEALAIDPGQRGRRGELLRTLGDVYRSNNDCRLAIDAYTRALAEHLGERDRKDAERGRDHCSGKP